MTDVRSLSSTSPPNLGIPQIVTIPTWDIFIHEFQKNLDHIEELVQAPPEYRVKVLQHSLTRFLRKVFVLPASQQHHDANSGGLVRHTLRVAIAVLETMQGNTFTYRDRIAQLIVVIQHDLGKIFHVQVTGTTSNQLSHEWVPHDQSLAGWCQKLGIQQLSITWKPKRSQLGPAAVEPLGNFLAVSIWPEAVVTLLGPAKINAIQMALTTAIGAPAVDLYTRFKEADIADAKTVVSNDDDWISTFLETIAQELLRKPSCNTTDAEAWITPTHLLLALPRTRNSSEHGTALVRDAGLFLQGLRQADPHAFSPESVLASTDRLLIAPGAPFIGDPSEATLTSARRHLLHLMNEDDRIIHTRLVTILPLAALFIGPRPSGFPQPLTAPATITRPSGKIGAITAADLGLRPLPTSSIRSSSSPLATEANASVKPDREALRGKALDDLSEIYRQLVPPRSGNQIILDALKLQGKIPFDLAYDAIADIRAALTQNNR